jgi:hypothetical protein
MAASGFTPISLYYSSTASAVPVNTNLANGELAINITDGKLFYKDNGGSVQVIAWKTTPATAGGTGQTTYTTGDLLYASATNTLSKLSAGTNGYVLTMSSGVPTWLASTGGVTSFQTSLSGLTPSTSTTGAVTLAGTLGATSGGTSQSTYTTGDLLYASSTNTLSKLAIGANNYVLTSNGTTVSWAAASGAQANGVIYENSLVISSNYTLTTSKNGMSVGPITINSGVTVTVPSGQRWVIL